MTLIDHLSKAVAAHAAPRPENPADAPITLTPEEARSIVAQAEEADEWSHFLLEHIHEQARVIAQLREQAEANRIALADALTPQGPVKP